jgi:hypothetical protein
VNIKPILSSSEEREISKIGANIKPILSSSERRQYLEDRSEETSPILSEGEGNLEDFSEKQNKT